MRTWFAGICLLVALSAGPTVGVARAQDGADDGLRYLEAVDLFHDQRADILVDPETGREVVTDFTTTRILEYQQLVDDEAWDVPAFLADEALLFLIDEIALLDALDAIEPTPEIDTIRGRHADELGGVDRDQLISGLDQVDRVLDQIRREILRSGATLPPTLDDAFGRIPRDWMTVIENGRRLPHAPYTAALGALLSAGTATQLSPELRGIEFVGFDRRLELLTVSDGLAEIVGVTVEEAATAPPREPVSDQPAAGVGGTSTDEATPGGRDWIPPLAVGSAIALALAAGWLAIGQRREPTPGAGVAIAGVRRLDSVGQLAFVDELTQLRNRRRLDRDLEERVHASTDDGAPVALAVLDVDHFRRFTDTHGQAAGDRALLRVAEIISMNVRADDVVYRSGGEEFSILLPHATPQEGLAVAERVRRAVEAAPVDGAHTQPGGRLTVSVGVSSTAFGEPEAIARRADAALDTAKRSGRNRVVTEPAELS